MKTFWLIGLLALMTLAGCTPLAITNVKATDDGCLSWSTNQEAQCKITYCEGTLCYTSPVEPDYSMLHCYSLPMPAKDITITAINRNGQAVSIGVVR